MRYLAVVLLLCSACGGNGVSTHAAADSGAKADAMPPEEDAGDEADSPPYNYCLKENPNVCNVYRYRQGAGAPIHGAFYSDKSVHMSDGSAYVFRPENKDNKYKPVDLNAILT